MRAIFELWVTAVDQILARHLVIDAERDPAHRPVDLPLQLGAARRGSTARSARPRPRSAISPASASTHLDRHLQHLAARRADRQHRRIGLAPLLAQRRQHHVHDRVVMAQHRLQRLVEPARGVAIATRRGTRSRSRTGRGTGAACRCCGRHSCRGRSRTGRAPCDSGWSRCSCIMSWCGTSGGTLRIPSMSSEKAISRLGQSTISASAWRTIIVRATSWKVPRCGRPDGP